MLTIYRKIAKQGDDLVLNIPRDLHPVLKAGTLYEWKIKEVKTNGDE